MAQGYYFSVQSLLPNAGEAHKNTFKDAGGTETHHKGSQPVLMLLYFQETADYIGKGFCVLLVSTSYL